MTGARPPRAAPDAAPDTLLCVSNFPSNTGFAWDFIERLYAGVANDLARIGVRTLVAYPEIVEPPRALAGSAAVAVQLDAQPRTARSLVALLAFVRAHNVRALYLSDYAPTSALFLALRLAGARHIIVHDHTSGARRPARGLKWIAKWLVARVPGLTADRVIAVSDYVARRQIEIALVPARRVTRVWNGVAPAATHESSVALRHELGAGAARAIVTCCCRAHPVKGVDHVLRAFDRVWRSAPEGARPLLAYIGDGPFISGLEALRDSLPSRQDIRFLGYRTDAMALLAGADVCVSASVWQEAFGLAVLEPMSLGRAVVATSVGGVPEIVDDEVSGILVAPGDDAALAAAIERLLHDAPLRARLGVAARRRAAGFTLDSQIHALSALAARAFERRSTAPATPGVAESRAHDGAT